MNLTIATQLIWSLAGREARLCEMDKVIPEHFFCALCKFSELSSTEISRLIENPSKNLSGVEAEQRTIQEILEIRHIEPTEARRGLRSVIGKGGVTTPPEVYHRSVESRTIFEEAARLALIQGDILETQHLFAALLSFPTWKMKPYLGDEPVTQPTKGVDKNRETASPIQDVEDRSEKEDHQPEEAIVDDGELAAIYGLAPEDGFSIPDVYNPQEILLKQALTEPSSPHILLFCEQGVPTFNLIGLADITLPPEKSVYVCQSTQKVQTYTPGNLADLLMEIKKGSNESIFLLADLANFGQFAVEVLREMQARLAESLPHWIITLPFDSKMPELDFNLTANCRTIWLHNLEIDSDFLSDSVRTIIEEARRDAWIQGQDTLGLNYLLAAIISHPQGCVFLARALGIPLDKLRKAYPAGNYSGTYVMASMEVSKNVQNILDSAHDLAQLEPDSDHPGWISVRHLACAIAQDSESCVFLKNKVGTEVDPLSLEVAQKKLNDWLEQDKSSAGLGEIASTIRVLRSTLLEKVYGQDHAIHAFVEGLFNGEIVAAADSNRKRPKAIFAFAGPPGVGKTFLAELGAEHLGRPFKRFDMSAYSDHQAYMDLVGFPPSFQAAKEGILTGFVKENPDCFLLFDEIEKAHLSTVNLFLQILDAGRLQDRFTAEDISFKNAIIIFTTNAGASLYDKPNESGILTANSSFHRQTILDALKTEKSPDGRPFFPPAICSRLATGYPVMFNHLGINELERIARAEIDRVANLIQQQHFKAISYDDALPLALVLREGAGADARVVRSQSGIFIQGELFKFSDLFTRQRLDRVWQSTSQVHFQIEGIPVDSPVESDGSSGKENVRPELKEAMTLFCPETKLKILLVALPELCELYLKHIPEFDWVTCHTAQDAMQTLAGTEVDMVLLDIWLGRSVQSLSLVGTAGQFDYAPLGARALSEGQQVLTHIHQRLSGLPVYLLSLVSDPGSEGSIDETLFLACVRSGGARGVLPSSFTSDLLPDWTNHRHHFITALNHVTMRMYREKKVRELTQQRKVLSFETVPAVEPGLGRVDIRLRNLRLSQAVSSADAGEVLSEIERPNVRFSDVFGAETAKEALQFIVDWMKNPRHYAALGVRPPKGILLTGDPGTGKTMLARALAGESGVAFIVASGTDFVTIWQGSGPQNVRELFMRARRYAPSILFIDEIDAIGKKRMSTGSAGRAEESTLNSLLTEMDGFGGPTLQPVILLAATNLAEYLDEALRRRFDREIEVPPPDRDARAAYLRHDLVGRKTSLVTDGLVDILAGRSAGMTISGLRRIVNEAAVMAARKGSPLTDAIVEEAFEKMVMGEAKGLPDPLTLERIARHESGHALISWLTGNPPVQVTIVGRGSAGGYVEREAQEEKMLYTALELENLICQAMAGRAAELIYYGEYTGLSTGVAGDLRQATAWAKRMVTEFGMDSGIGQVYLSDSGQDTRVSPAAEQIVKRQLVRAGKMLEENRTQLDQLSVILLRKNRLTKKEMEEIIVIS